MPSAAVENANQSLCELSITRIFDAPRELVFQAFSEPEHAQRWMGPRGFVASYIAQDARPGGKWRLCLHQTGDWNNKQYPDMWQGGTFREIVPPERVVYTFAWEGDGSLPTRETLVTITFHQLPDGKTQMEFHQAFFENTGSRDGHHQGWSSSFDRLAEYVTTM